MIEEPAQPRPSRGAALDLLTAEDLDPYAVDELQDRIARLEREVARAQAAVTRKSGERARAEALFSFTPPERS